MRQRAATAVTGEDRVPGSGSRIPAISVRESREREWNDCKPGQMAEHRCTRLYSKRRQKEKTGRERAADGAHRVRQIEGAGTRADGVLHALDDGVGERKAEPHQQCGYSGLQQDRRRVEPQLGQCPCHSGRRIRGGSRETDRAADRRIKRGCRLDRPSFGRRESE